MRPRWPSPISRARLGAALVIVLAILVLMTVLIAAFFSSVTTDFSASKAYSQGETAKQLADSAVNVVMAQIKDATAGFSRPDPSSPLDTSERLAWASQPGMIRTWNDSGAPANSYKLYSSDTMVVSGTGYDPLTEMADMQNVGGSGGPWTSNPAIYTDLNSPVLVRDDVKGTIISDPSRPSEKYVASSPIIDPNNLVSSTSLNPAGPANTLTYDSNKDGKPDIEGFSVSVPPTYDSGKPLSPVNNPVPMPVKWIYVLQDGQLTAPAASGANAVFNVQGQPVPTDKNPIVGRIAFWADDESAKINVNTASEGIFWDTPTSASLDEMSFAANPPTKGEFQRTPGHPAMTCLSSVLGNGTININHGTLSSAEISTFTQNLKKIYDFTPRFAGGDASLNQGSQGGTAPIADRNYAYAPLVGDLKPNFAGSGAQNIILPKAIPSGTSRLYTTVDDILFKVDRTPQDPTVINEDSLKQNRFFLTANSRAPEVNLFNMPRISLWPITWPYRSAHILNSGTTAVIPTSNGNPDTQPLSALLNVPLKFNGPGKYLTPQEQLIAFCTQIGSGTNAGRYFFQRQNPDDSQYDYSNIKRNREILARLRDFTGSDVPGFGGSFAAKYGSSGRDSILVNAFDSIRGANLTATGTNAAGINSVQYAFAAVYFNVDPQGTLGANSAQPTWQVSPLRIDLGSGAQKSIGKFPTIPEVALIFYATRRDDPWPVSSGTGGTVVTGTFDAGKMITATNPQTTEMRMVLYVNEFSPGTPFIRPSYWIKATGSPFRVNGASINFPAANGNVVQMREALWTTGVGLVNRYFTESYAPHYPKNFSLVGDSKYAYRRWEFVSDPIPINPANGPTFTFDGSVVTFDLYGPNPTNQNDSSHLASAQKIQSIQINFAELNGSAAVPLAPRWIPNQIIPEGAISKTAGDGLVPATQQVPSSNPKMYYARGPHPEVARAGMYIYQDEGFDTMVTGTNPAPLLNLKKISPSWQLRMACASAAPVEYAATPPENGNPSGTPPPPIPDLPLLSGTSVPYPVYYPDNLRKLTTVGDGYFGATSVITPYDTVLSMALDPLGPSKGDARVIAALPIVPSSYFAPATTGPSRDFEEAPVASYPRTTAGWQRHRLSTSSSTDKHRLLGRWGSGVDPATSQFSLLDGPMATIGFGWINANGNQTQRGGLGSHGEVGVNAFGRTVSMNSGPLGDWTNALGNFPDGGTTIYPDQFYATLGSSSSAAANSTAYVPYFAHTNTGDDVSKSADYFSPSRQIASGVTVFGTLPTTDSSGIPQPWQTLLFCPNPAIGSSHPGFGNIGSVAADHLLLDLFWMPVVEPYAISEPLATAGKINLNYQIAPFTNISRKTGLYAVMKSAKITAIPSTSASMLTDYKSASRMRTAHANVSTRREIDVDETLKAFDTKFAGKDIFRSASQICEIFLVPKGETLSSVQSGSFWESQALTGDNSREAPYGHIYPRVTTKSNTFEVHYKVQILKKRTGSNQATWEEGKDKVVGEYRGSTILERYIDPNDSRLPDFITTALNDPNGVIDKYYRFRVVSTKNFNP